MKCPECGRLIGHESWCPDYPEPFYNPLDDFLKNNEYDEPTSLITFPKPSDFEPAIPEIKLPQPFQEDKPDFLKNLLEPHKPPLSPLPEPKPLFDPQEPLFKPQEPLFRKPEPILPEPMTEKPQFIPPPTGIVRNDLGNDTGIRFTDGGIIKNDLGHSLGKVDQNLIYNDLGHLIGKAADDGRIMDLNGLFTGDFIDKHKL